MKINEFGRCYRTTVTALKRWVVAPPRIDTNYQCHPAKNGQSALDNSIQVKPTSPRRVAVDHATGEFVIFEETLPGVFHGHIRSWQDLHPDMQRALIKAGQVTPKGRIKDVP